MSRPSPYTMTIGEDGMSIRCEWDVHYLTDEQLETVRKHVETLQAENAKLRELVEYMHRCYVIGHDWGPYGAPEKHWVEERMRELGVEVDA